MSEYMELMAEGMKRMNEGVSEATGLYATKAGNCLGCHSKVATGAIGDNKWMTV